MGRVRRRVSERVLSFRPSLFVDAVDEAFFFQLDDEPVVHDIVPPDAAR